MCVSESHRSPPMSQPKMPTEAERQQMLKLLDANIHDMDKIIEGMQKNFGIKATPEEILASIEFLRKQRGSE